MTDRTDSTPSSFRTMTTPVFEPGTTLYVLGALDGHTHKFVVRSVTGWEVGDPPGPLVIIQVER